MAGAAVLFPGSWAARGPGHQTLWPHALSSTGSETFREMAPLGSKRESLMYPAGWHRAVMGSGPTQGSEFVCFHPGPLVAKGSVVS